TAVDTLAPGTEAYGLLRALQRLFALRWIDRNSGDLLARGRLTAYHIDQLPDLVERLIAELAGSAPTLVAAFALPEELLADHPIGRAHYTGAYDDPAAPWHTEPVHEPVHEPAHEPSAQPSAEPSARPSLQRTR
ncbi:hypothetical protein HY68_09775, partial [Streptomyces sp. AcH 505]|uniref:acyl-CoA dehydrogenase n=1 Tax=Streptomyces sp. AcH 505 TaxID=352211 RepID=UPI000591A6FE